MVENYHRCDTVPRTYRHGNDRCNYRREGTVAILAAILTSVSGPTYGRVVNVEVDHKRLGIMYHRRDCDAVAWFAPMPS